MKAFTDDMQAQGNMGRVLVMTFSEFGRRVSENANGGTDHGAAAPMFIVGDKVKAGLLGKYPSLAPQDLFQGDVKYNVDFRSVYAAVLENWLKTQERADARQDNSRRCRWCDGDAGKRRRRRKNLLKMLCHEQRNIPLLEEFSGSHDANFLVKFLVKMSSFRVDRDQVICLHRQRNFNKAVVRLVFDGGGGE